MANSSLIDVTMLSPHCSKPRKDKIKKITIHHMAGDLSVETCGKVFNGDKEASSNYGIDSQGRVGLYVEEENRAWTSGSPSNDHQAITIEVANDEIGGQWHVSEKAYDKLIELCVDICKRNDIEKLIYTNDNSGNLTRHNMFQNTICPGPYLQSRFPDIAKDVNIQLEKSKPVINEVNMEKDIYDYLRSKGMTHAGACGLMGNLYAESGLKANNLQNNGNSRLGISDDEFVLIVDNGVYNRDTFINDKYGFGLAQWTFWSRKQNLYDYMKSKGVSIGHLGSQLEFIVNEIQGYKEVYKVLTNTNDLKEASDIVLLQYERPADQSENTKDKRYNFSKVYYDKYNKDTSSVVNKLYRVRLSWDNVKSQLGAFKNLDNAKKVCVKGYSVYDWDGNEVYNNKFKPYLVKVTTEALNYRKGPGINYKVNGTIRDLGVYTIVDEQNGWGKLKSGQGWISLNYTKKV